jgi:hypothetical protein
MLNIFDQEPESTATPATILVHVGSFSFPVHHHVDELLKLLQSNTTVHWVSRATWSAIDLLVAILAAHQEPAKIYLSSYAFSEKPARIFANLIDQGKITWLRCIIDSRVDVRSQPALQLLRGCADQLVMADTHAKVTIIHIGDRFYTIVGSANYTTNKRHEAGIITTCPETAAFHKKWIKDVIELNNTGNA